MLTYLSFLDGFNRGLSDKWVGECMWVSVWVDVSGNVVVWMCVGVWMCVCACLSMGGYDVCCVFIDLEELTARSLLGYG